MTFGRALTFCIDSTAAFLARLWWLALVPVLPDLSLALMSAVGLVPEHVQSRLYLSVLALSVSLKAIATYWTMRFFALGHDVAQALSVDRQSARTFAPYVIVMTVLLFVGALFNTASNGTLLLVAIVLTCTDVLFAPWAVAAPSGSQDIGPRLSVRAASRSFVWGFVLLCVVQLPFGLLAMLLDFMSAHASGSITATVAAEIVGATIGAASLTTSFAAMFVIAVRSGVRISHAHSEPETFD